MLGRRWRCWAPAIYLSIATLRGSNATPIRLLPRQTPTTAPALNQTSLPTPFECVDLRGVDDDDLPLTCSTTLGTNFTSESCPTLFRSLRASQPLQACVPLSLLVSSSSAFLLAQRNATLLTSILDRSCSAPSNCTTVMSVIADQLRNSTNGCAADLAAGNALATKALTGLLAYDAMREVGCLVAPTTKRYCMIDATATGAPPGNAYIYQLASPGTPLPVNTSVSCDACTYSSMNTLARYAGNSSLALSKTYAPSAALLNQACGPSFLLPIVSGAPSPRAGFGLPALIVFYCLYYGLYG